MKRLSDYFLGIGFKRLSPVEIDPERSNQHELNGVTKFRQMFGTEKRCFTCRFIYLPDDTDSFIEETGRLTWYDARENHATRTEYRFYYTATGVFQKAKGGDLLIVLWRNVDELWIVIAPKDSTAEQQLIWLFNIEEGRDPEKLNVRTNISEKEEMFARDYILETLGIEISISDEDYLTEMLKIFDGVFPSTSVFSEYARSTLGVLPVTDDPDQVLLLTYGREELLFKILEGHFVKERLRKGFGEDGLNVEQFISYSLQVQNRRKSRAGFSLENHLTYIFKNNYIHFSRGVITERKSKPDFIFPHIDFYRDPFFDPFYLKMLGAKTTAKDRWRQVLSESERIKNKHLITLEPAISIAQTDEMKAHNVTLVVPKEIQSTYTQDQQKDLLSLSDFLRMIKENEQKAGLT